MIQCWKLMICCENNPAGVKGFLTAMGLIQNHLRLPLVPLSDEVMKKVKQYVAAL